ncbi:hypothetical protein [Coraliomargarita parva]|uniref:hypothetical protein n=1 Tax=Coraliomargarita parva TaxID=3014050 RepID=UPI0022B3C471|nr:hypothetical protein [Coraliomargarita parva]
MKRSSLALLLTTLQLTSVSLDALEYSDAYTLDHAWPDFVTPTENAYNESGLKILEKGIPAVFIRAYPDGMLAVVDREGAQLVPYDQTDFLGRLEKSSHMETDSKIFLNQISRRVFDLDFDASKAVSETELAKFDSFLVLTTPCEDTDLIDLKEQLAGASSLLKRLQVTPIVIFESLMPNNEFYEKVTRTDFTYPVVVPIFQKGFIQAVYSQREIDYPVLWVQSSGKLEGQFKDLKAALGELSR